MQKIKFTSGTIQRLSDKYFTLTLFNSEAAVYTATIDKEELDLIAAKYSKIKIVN